MSLNKYEKRLIEILEKKGHINTRKFIELANIGKGTFYKYTESLETEGYISYEKIKNENVWYLMRKKKKDDWGILSFEEYKKMMETRYNEIESKILQSIKKAKSGNVNDKVIGYGDSILLLLSTLGFLKLISHYRKKQVPDVDVQFVKKIEKLLEKIIDKEIDSQYAYGRLSIEHVIRTTEERLNEFLGIKKPEIVYV
jgi:hypothetical protein